ncbi:universal stress protein [Nitrosomonas aestuarii]|uniref:universal stress protein n=1 Tax=Nitrosomonas aestuarii TaxID=52441 RepID=UPI000D310A36|nr:universal stress protein [Nitrosomonas aestuarii]PTN11207.1 nucleotide-binding universal stress UspA family protein [Nitrosomonas aestuarii]
MTGFTNILCVIESGKACKPALARAAVMAENNQASLTVINMIERITGDIETLERDSFSTDLQAMVLRHHEQQTELLVKPYRKKIQIQTKILTGIPFLEIVREVLRFEYDLVIKMAETRDWLGRIFGSEDMHLLRKCPCPVWLIKPGAPQSCQRILAAVDVNYDYLPSELQTRKILNQKILELAGSLALSEFASLYIVHAWEAVGEDLMRTREPFMNTSDEKIAIYVDQVRKQHQQNMNTLVLETTNRLGKDAMDYLKPRIHLVKGAARKVVPTLARQIETDLIIMGTVARTGIPGFIMGNTAEEILNQIDCSVLAVKPPGFATPITLMD